MKNKGVVITLFLMYLVGVAAVGTAVVSHPLINKAVGKCVNAGGTTEQCVSLVHDMSSRNLLLYLQK